MTHLTAADVAFLVIGVVVVAFTVMSALVTVVVPRGEPVRLTNTAFRASRKLFELRNDLRHDYERRDRSTAPRSGGTSWGGG